VWHWRLDLANWIGTQTQRICAAIRGPSRIKERFNADLDSDQRTAGVYVVAEPVETPDPFLPPGLQLPVLIEGGLAHYIPYDSEWETTVAISADLLQQYIEEDLSPWPRCPAHDHALEAHVVRTRAVWCCPSDAAIRYRIGSLSDG
jgi:hypothetical protein